MNPACDGGVTRVVPSDLTVMICLQMLGFMIDLGGVSADAVRGRCGVVVGRAVARRGAGAARRIWRDWTSCCPIPELLVPIAIRWELELAEASRFADRGRPSLAMET